MSGMGIILEIHLYVAFLIVLLAVFIGWVQMGRRTLVAVIGLQVLVGVAVAGVLGANHVALPAQLWAHIIGALLAMFAYIVGRRLVDRQPSQLAVGWLVSAAGLVLVLFTAWLGYHMVLHG